MHFIAHRLCWSTIFERRKAQICVRTPSDWYMLEFAQLLNRLPANNLRHHSIRWVMIRFIMYTQSSLLIHSHEEERLLYVLQRIDSTWLMPTCRIDPRPLFDALAEDFTWKVDAARCLLLTQRARIKASSTLCAPPLGLEPSEPCSKWVFSSNSQQASHLPDFSSNPWSRAAGRHSGYRQFLGRPEPPGSRAHRVIWPVNNNMPEADSTRVLGGRTQEQSRHAYTKKGSHLQELAIHKVPLHHSFGWYAWTEDARRPGAKVVRSVQFLGRADHAGGRAELLFPLLLIPSRLNCGVRLNEIWKVAKFCGWMSFLWKVAKGF